jgi:CheY-like chemotaxis protein
MTRILVVDDAKIDRLLARSLLEAGHYEVECVASGKLALEALERRRPDAVVTDLVMPEMDGLELVAHLRALDAEVPVILMTSRGSEEIAVAALQAGASSYVPKRLLEGHLFETLTDVLAVSEDRLSEQRILASMQRSSFEFELPNDVKLVSPLVRHLQGATRQMGLCDAAQCNQVAMALHEAVQNAAEHGNLELQSDMRDDDLEAYFALMESRAESAPFKDRRIRVQAQLDRDQASFTVADEGPGFDPAELPDPTEPTNLEKLSGRGVLLMRTFMDEVIYNDIGNAVTLVKRRSA